MGGIGESKKGTGLYPPPLVWNNNSIIRALQFIKVTKWAIFVWKVVCHAVTLCRQSMANSKCYKSAESRLKS